jgi:hypothetical protein
MYVITQSYIERGLTGNGKVLEPCHTTTLVSITLILTGGGLALNAKPNVYQQ